MRPITSGGENIFPDEVEAVLRFHPAVADAAVVGVPDTQMGQRLVALIEAGPRQVAPSLEELRQFCIGRLTGFKVPRVVVPVEKVHRASYRQVDQDWAQQAVADALASASGQ